MNQNSLFHTLWITLAVIIVISAALCIYRARRGLEQSPIEKILKFAGCVLAGAIASTTVVRFFDTRLNNQSASSDSKPMIVTLAGKLLTYESWPYPESGERKLLIHSAQFDRIETPLPVFKYLVEDLKTGEHFYVHSNDRFATNRVMVLGITTVEGLPASSIEVLEYQQTLQVLREHGRRFAPQQQP